MFFKIFRKSFFQRKNLIFLYDFRKFSNFQKFPEKIFFHFQSRKILFKKNELKKKSSYHFDVEFCQESIFGIDKSNMRLKKVRIFFVKKQIYRPSTSEILCILMIESRYSMFAIKLNSIFVKV